jgi:glycosyltransferase involved in cell wall biosynthesis
MRVLYLHQYFKTPSEGGAIRSYYIARSMVEAGHDVTVFTTHNAKGYSRQQIEGICVHYFPIAYANHFSFFSRLWAFTVYAAKSIGRASSLKKFDLCYATSTPLTVGIPALWLKWVLGIPYIFEVRDLWPAAPIALKIIRNPIAKWLALQLELLVYRHAHKLVALSPGIQQHVQNKAGDKPVLMAPNMSDCDFFTSSLSSQPLPFHIVYIGTAGYANHLDYLLEAALFTQNSRRPVRFTIAGEGAEISRLRHMTSAYQLKNVAFVGMVNKYAVRDLLHSAHAVYISFRKEPVLQSGSPNKFFDALAAGKMVITNTPGWISDYVERYGLGFYYDPEHPQQFDHKLSEYLALPKKIAQAQKAARSLAQAHFDTKIITGKLLEFIGM